jgi:PAS domain S-box-containing protein
MKDASGILIGVSTIARDITERKRAAETLRASQQIIEEIINAIPVRVFWKDKNLVYLGCNAVFARDAGFADPKDIIGKDDSQMGWRDQAEKYRADDRQVIESGCSKLLIEESQTTPEGNTITLLSSKIPLRSSNGEISGVLGTYMDITERKRFEAQMFQSQKMETVGKLAGGIAHEFNSIMTAIIGYSELLLIDLPPENPLCRNARQIRQAADRAAALTRQLLAYGRKQILQPGILDLNSILAGMENVLRHLVGNNGEVRITPGPGLKAVKADAGQIEQVIVNIAMNAAEAMPNGGTLSLETDNVTLDEAYVSRFPELKAGEYVMLAISDTGVGMSEAVRTRVFEPFFSTKPVGQGTGLGLATCYGILKQSGGHISVYSEPARGSTFKIYLPPVEAPAQIPVQRIDTPDLPRGTETILLVEDDPALREMAATLLTRLGYAVMTAANGVEALSLKQQRGVGHVDLLFTDVVMPHMSGKELSDRVRVLYPHTRILFTSAYTENSIVHQGVLDPGVALLQKPFTPGALARKVREMLDAAPRTADS